jgi:hypothetical protein
VDIAAELHDFAGIFVAELAAYGIGERPPRRHRKVASADSATADLHHNLTRGGLWIVHAFYGDGPAGTVINGNTHFFSLLVRAPFSIRIYALSMRQRTPAQRISFSNQVKKGRWR